MLLHFFLATLGLVGLYFGAEWLVRGSAALALRLGISALVIGLTVVAFGTSSPELLVSLQANYSNNGDISISNVIGSNICNIALILGISGLIRPLNIQSQLVRREVPILILITAIFTWFILNQEVARWEGAVLFAGIVLYLLTGFSKDDDPPEEIDEEDAKMPLPRQIGFILIGLVVLAVGARLLVINGAAIAEDLGVPKVIIGLTLVAIGTSLPELATSIVASMKRQGDIITGNAIGSCVFNILAVIGITALAKPILFTGIEKVDLYFMGGLALILFPIVWTRKTLSRLEGTFLLLIYIVYLGFIAQRVMANG